MTAGAFILLVSDWGITGFISRARARGSDSLVNGSLRVNDITSAALAIAAIPLCTAASGHPALPLLALSVVYERNSETQLSVFYADGYRKVPMVSVVGRRVIALGTFVALLSTGIDGLWCFALGQAAGTGFAQLYQRRKIRGLSIGAGSADMRTVILDARHFWFGAVLGHVRLLDTLIVAIATTAVSAGIYSAAQRLTSPILLLPAALSQILLPHAARSHDGGARAARRITILTAATYLLIAPICPYTSEILSFVFGPDYASGGPILTWVLIGLPLVALSGPLAAILQGRGRERVVSRNGVVFAALALVGMMSGVALAGAEGLAAGLTVASLLRLPVIVFVACRGETPPLMSQK